MTTSHASSPYAEISPPLSKDAIDVQGDGQSAANRLYTDAYAGQNKRVRVDNSYVDVDGRGLPTKRTFDNGSWEIYDWKNNQVSSIRYSDGTRMVFENGQWSQYARGGLKPVAKGQAIDLIVPGKGSHRVSGAITAEMLRQLAKSEAYGQEQAEPPLRIDTAVGGKAVVRDKAGKISQVNYLDGSSCRFEYDQKSKELVGIEGANGLSLRKGADGAWQRTGEGGSDAKFRDVRLNGKGELSMMGSDGQRRTYNLDGTVSTREELNNKAFKEYNIRSGDRSATLELGEDGTAKKFRDFNGDEFTRDGDKWYRKNVMTGEPGEEVNFSVNPAGSLSITYAVARDENDAAAGTKSITRTLHADGHEETYYPEGSRTVTSRDGNTRTLTTEFCGKQTSQLKYSGEELVEVQAGGCKYVKETVPAGFFSSQRRVWKRYGQDGSVQTIEGSVKADSNGAVVIRDDNFKGTDGYATRFLPNGVMIKSDEVPTTRTTVTPEGTQFQDSMADGKLQKRVYTYPNNGGGITLRFDGDRVTAVTGNAGGKAVDLRCKDNVWSDATGSVNVADVNWDSKKKDVDSISIRLAGGDALVIDGKGKMRTYHASEAVPPPVRLEERCLVQEVPPGFENRLADRVMHLKGCSTKYGAMLDIYTNTKDSGAWDEKQRGGQYQQFGNFIFGAYIGAIGMSEDEANQWVGWYKQRNNKSNASWTTTHGQNPADAAAMHRGLEYYERTAAKTVAVK